jgi:hypothetical protein
VARPSRGSGRDPCGSWRPTLGQQPDPAVGQQTNGGSLAETRVPGAPTSSLSLGRIPVVAPWIPAAAFDWRGRVVYGLVG